MQHRVAVVSRRAAGFLVCAAAITLGGAVIAQRVGGFGERLPEGQGVPIRSPTPDFEDGKFTHCKLQYTSVRSEMMGIGWWTDYPYAGIHLATRLGELTKTPISKTSDGETNYWVVRATDDALFQCPFVAASDVGTIGLSPDEVTRLRAYLLKGGFLWVDDFWGDAAWAQWSSQIAKVLPPSEYPIVDLPIDHAVFHTMFDITGFGEALTDVPAYPSRGSLTKVPQITNINNWRRTHNTSERGSESPHASFRAILDKRGRIMVAMTFNTDMGDSWEREGEDQEFFQTFSPPGYALGVDVLLYAMTH